MAFWVVLCVEKRILVDRIQLQLLAPHLREGTHEHRALGQSLRIGKHRVRELHCDGAAIANAAVVQMAESLQYAQWSTNLGLGRRREVCTEELTFLTPVCCRSNRSLATIPGLHARQPHIVHRRSCARANAATSAIVSYSFTCIGKGIEQKNEQFIRLWIIADLRSLVQQFFLQSLMSIKIYVQRCNQLFRSYALFRKDQVLHSSQRIRRAGRSGAMDPKIVVFEPFAKIVASLQAASHQNRIIGGRRSEERRVG